MVRGRRQSICYIVPGLDLVPGSASTRHTLGLARALAAHADVTVAFRRVTGSFARDPLDIVALEPNGRAPSGDTPPSRRALGRFMEERCAAYGTVLEGTWPMMGKVTAWCAQRGIPAVPIVERQPPAHWREPLIVGRSWLVFGATGRYLRRAPVVMADSDDLKAAIVRRWRVAPDRVVVAGTGVDRTRFVPHDQAEARRRLGWSPQHRILLAGGVLDRARDLAPLIEAVQRVGDPDLRLHVLGQGERRLSLERLAGTGGMVTFHGRIGDDLLPTFMAAADLCVSIEHPGGQLSDPASEAAFTVAECLVSGRPVVVGSDGDRSHPLVRHLVSGFLVQHDLLAWIRFLQRDCPSRNTLRIMGQAATATPVDGLDQVASIYLASIDRARTAMKATAAAS
ncbi:MAG: glycosyltransferase [Gemmatimonadales bacterium]